MKKATILFLSAFCLSCFMLLTGCGDLSLDNLPLPDEKLFDVNEDLPLSSDPTQTSGEKGSRDNTPVALIPEAPGTVLYSNDVASIDASNSADGYVAIRYQGASPKVKLQIIGSNQVTYTYDIIGKEFEFFPLTSGNGTYSITVFEIIEGTRYATSLFQEISVAITDELKPFLYPNQYVKFGPDSKVVAKASELAFSADSDLDVITNVYNYVTSTITYDYEKAQNVANGYISDADAILESKTGICLDYAAVMASMLRSQGIPTHLEVGYAQEAYHAWISSYIEDVGWVNGIIEFDGKDWSLMDPTFAANMNNDNLKNFIGDGTNYTVKYVY